MTTPNRKRISKKKNQTENQFFMCVRMQEANNRKSENYPCGVESKKKYFYTEFWLCIHNAKTQIGIYKCKIWTIIRFQFVLSMRVIYIYVYIT